MLHVIGLLVIAGILGLYYFCFKNLGRFKKHGIPHKRPLPLIGNMGPLLFRLQSLAELTKSMYNLQSDAKYVGMYDMTNPIVVLRDPELIKLITLKHFDLFTNHLHYVDETQDMLFGRNLFCLHGEKWRKARALLSPSFTSSKMKGMFKLMLEYSANFSNYLAQMPPEKRTMEIKNIFIKYTNDVIATCAFGINIDSMRDPNNEFYAHNEEVKNFTRNMMRKTFIFRNFPWIARIIRLKYAREELVNFFRDIIKTTVKTRDEKGIVRPDMLQLMMESRSDESKPDLSMDDMVSQAFLFFLGTFETTTDLTFFAAYEIAMNPDILETLQKEIDGVLEETNGQATYEAINNMEYLDAVIHEALRKYPGFSIADRSCLKDFELPPTLPGTKPFIIKKGEGIIVPLYALHHDPKHFVNPQKFDPERFLGERKKESLNCGAFLPFGLGPRMCIGNRFALLQTKALFFNWLARCDLKFNVKTTLPFKFNKGSFTNTTDDALWLDVTVRKNLHRSIVIPNEMCKA